MRKLLLLLLLFSSKITSSQDTTAQKPSSLYLGIGQDSYFGFYVCASGSYSLKPSTNFTFYTNYWANPAFGNLQTGTDFWTETGIGISKTYKNGLTLNPSVGITYGKVLSGGEKGVLGDGITPALFAYYAKGKMEGNAGFVYFKTLRTEGPITIDFIWYWAELGRKLGKNFSVGAHYEHFYLSRMTEVEPVSLYRWLGPYLQYNFPNGCYLKNSVGIDFDGTEYIKVALNVPLFTN